MALWTPVMEGTAVGPTAIISLGGDEFVAMALWDEDSGVQVDVHVPDQPLTIEQWKMFSDAVYALLLTPAPELTP